MSEAAYLESQSDGGAEDDMRELDEQAYYKGVDNMQARYRDNKRSEVGTTIRCAGCKKRILKKSYQTQFCSNKGPNNCKDNYWNNTSDKRRYRAQYFAR